MIVRKSLDRACIYYISTHGWQESLLTKTVIENVFIGFVPTACKKNKNHLTKTVIENVLITFVMAYKKSLLTETDENVYITLVPTV